jgi:hypothetical protein
MQFSNNVNIGHSKYETGNIAAEIDASLALEKTGYPSDVFSSPVLAFVHPFSPILGTRFVVVWQIIVTC